MTGPLYRFLPRLLAAAMSLVALCAATASAATRPSNAEIMFRLDNPCPATGATRGACKGYVIDRVIPLVCGGAEAPENMRWATLAEAKAKARWDRIGCRRGRKLVLPGSTAVETEAFAMGETPAPVEAQPLPETTQ
jgi:hypothetical protein